MGNKSSSPDGGNWEPPPATQSSSSSSGWQHSSAQATYSQYAQNYPKQNPYPAGNPPQDQSNAPPPTNYDTPSNAHPQNYHVQDPYPAGYPPQDQYNAPPPPPPPNFDTPSTAPPRNYPVQDPYPAGYPTQDQYNANSSNYGIPYNAPTQNYPPSQVHAPKKKFDKRYSTIADNYNSLEEVSEALARAGLESSNLIVGIDFTKSNEWTGKGSYNGQSLHHIGYGPNPYEQAITIIGKTLASFDDDNLIPCFGFGDASTHDQDVFSFYPDERCCHGFEEVIRRYRELVPNLKLAGPTSFAPIIEMAMTIVEKSGCQYHVLLIIADGQVTRSVDTEHGQLSPQEQKTVQAIVEASKFPLSIILVGVGDGPWDTMKEFDDNIPAREFDNFQFVNFTEIMSKNVHQTRKETEFALSALMEIPPQYKATMEFNLLGGRKGNSPERFALPPPLVRGAAFESISKPSHAANIPQSTSFYFEHNIPPDAPPSAPSYPYEHQICPICLSNPKDMAFGCGHQTCMECGKDLQLCPICRLRIETRLKLY